MKVKVEELEMETPIRPPESPRRLPFSSVKQEDGEPGQKDPSASGVPTLKAAQEERVQGQEAAKTSPELGRVKQKMSGETSEAERT